MASSKEKRDKHFPLFVNDNPFRRLFSSPNEFCSYVAEGQVVVDLGCGPGYYTLALAERVDPEGRGLNFNPKPKILLIPTPSPTL